MHKYALHGLGRNRDSFWAFHWHDHHRNVRKNQFEDQAYHQSLLQWNPHSKEVLSLVAGAAVVTPLLPVAPFFVGTLYYCAWNYYRVHRESHLDPEWAKTHLPWHYDHPMGPNPNANWCVTKPWFDYVMGTREFRADGEREANVLGLAKLPKWLAKRLPMPERLGRTAAPRRTKPTLARSRAA